MMEVLDEAEAVEWRNNHGDEIKTQTGADLIESRSIGKMRDQTRRALQK
jgi:hypothetical protein